MTSREHALKKQLLKAQDLIRQFEDGSGRHNSNLDAAGRDAEARVNLTQALCRAFLPTVFGDPDLETWIEHRVKPIDELEIRLLELGLLRARPQDCIIGQIVRLEAIESIGRWTITPGYTLDDVTGWGDGVVALNSFEFERVRYFRSIGPRPSNPTEPQNVIEREFWKRIA